MTTIDPVVITTSISRLSMPESSIARLQAIRFNSQWSLSVNSDYVYPETEGDRPANFAVARALAATLRKLCDTDPEFLNFRMRLAHMLETNNSLREGPLAIKFFTALQGAMAPPA